MSELSYTRATQFLSNSAVPFNPRKQVQQRINQLLKENGFDFQINVKSFKNLDYDFYIDYFVNPKNKQHLEEFLKLINEHNSNIS